MKEFIWGVLDIIPSEVTDFPDIRNKAAIHSTNGSCMIVPREGDMIRLYIQLSGTDAVDPETGHLDLSHYDPSRLMEVVNKTLQPYTIDVLPDQIDWWSIYRSEY